MSRPTPLRLLPYAAAAFAAVPALPSGAAAQGFLKRVQKAAQQAAAEAATRKAAGAARTGTEKGVDAAAGTVGDKIGGVVPGRDAAGGAPAAAAPGATAGAGGAAAEPVVTPPAAAAAVVRPGEGAWANYDFVPGGRVLFAEDFAQETVGNFPRRLAHRSGTSEVVEWQGRRWLSSGGDGAFVITLPEVLPEQFTMEFDLTGSGNAMEVTFDGKSDRYNKRGADYLAFGTWFADLKGPGRASTTSTGRDTKKAVVRARIMADGEYVKVFVDERRVVNVPDARLGRSQQIYVLLNGWSAEAPRLVGDVRVAAGGRRLYDALAERGRVATQGILFATASAAVRPESGPTLREIAAMLAEHPGLRLTVEGHTDDAGDAAANRALSQARAEAVRQALVSGYGADAARLEARGHGASRPAAPNATPEGRAANRRVELVKR